MKILQGLCLLDRDEDPFLDQISARTAELFGVSCCSWQLQPAAASQRVTAAAVVARLMLPGLQAGCQGHCLSLALHTPLGLQRTTMLCYPGYP